MNCSEFHKEISSFIDGELAGPTREALLLHLDECPDCRQIHERMVAVTRDVKAICGPVPSLSLAIRIKERVASERARQQGKDFFPAWSTVPLMALVIFLALGSGNLAGRSVTEILAPYRAEAMLDYMIPEQNGTLAEVVMNIGVEENSR